MLKGGFTQKEKKDPRYLGAVFHGEERRKKNKSNR